MYICFIMCGRTAQFRPQKIPCCFCMVYFSGRSDWAALARALGSFAWTRTGILPSASRLRFEPLSSLVQTHTFVQNKKHHKSGAFYFGRSDWAVIPTAMRRAPFTSRWRAAFRTKHYFIMCGRTAQFRPQKIPCFSHGIFFWSE